MLTGWTLSSTALEVYTTMTSQVTTEEQRQCRVCQHWYPLADYGKATRSPGGRKTRCKACEHQYYLDHQEETKARTKARYWANTEAAYEWRQRHYKANRERILEEQRAFRQANPEVIKDRKRREYKNNREDYAARREAWKKANPERLREWYREYRHKDRRSNPTRYAEYQHRRRALKQGNGGTFAPKQWEALRIWFGDACLCCGATGKLVIDHVVPLSKGGDNTIQNLQPLCVSCNSRKHANTVDYRDPQQLASFLRSLEGYAPTIDREIDFPRD